MQFGLFLQLSLGQFDAVRCGLQHYCQRKLVPIEK